MQKLKQLIDASGIHIDSDATLIVAVNNLPDEYKQPIQLHYFNNLSRKQIAEELNWSYSKVHNRITRGVTLLKTELNPAYFDQMRQLAIALYSSSSNRKSNENAH